MQYITFYIGENRYGLPIVLVREVRHLDSITPVQGTDARIEGLMNLRGNITTVINLGTCLNLGPVSQDRSPRLVVMKNNRELSVNAQNAGLRTCRDTVAFLVDRIGDEVDSGGKAMEPPPAHVDNEHEYIKGVIQLEDELLVVLSSERLLPAA